MDNEFDRDPRNLNDPTRDSPFTGSRYSGVGGGVAFLIGAILVVFAIVAYGSWTGDQTSQQGTNTPTEQPAQQPIQPAPQPPAGDGSSG